MIVKKKTIINGETTALVLKMKYFIVILLVFSSCSSQKDYKVVISQMDPETKVISEKVLMIKATSDSSAFKTGCSQYWSQKASVLEVNKTFEGTPNYPALPIPFFFSIESKEGTAISFPKEEAERLTLEIVNYYQTKVIPFIDTITPMIKKPKQEPAKIY